MTNWEIREYEGLELTGTYYAPGNLSYSEIITILKQLAAKYLEPREIISANIRRPNKSSFLDVRHKDGKIEIGDAPYFLAIRLVNSK